MSTQVDEPWSSDDRSDLLVGAIIESYDWASTALGPRSQWPSALTTTVELILASPVPVVTLWYDDGVMIYNDAYSGFAGARHPKLFGSPVRLGWPEVADFNDNVMKVGLAGGHPLVPRQGTNLVPVGRSRTSLDEPGLLSNL